MTIKEQRTRRAAHKLYRCPKCNQRPTQSKNGLVQCENCSKTDWYSRDGWFNYVMSRRINGEDRELFDDIKRALTRSPKKPSDKEAVHRYLCRKCGGDMVTNQAWPNDAGRVCASCEPTLEELAYGCANRVLELLPASGIGETLAVSIHKWVIRSTLTALRTVARSHKAGLLASEEVKGGRGLEYEWNKFHETQNRPDEKATLDEETVIEWKHI